MDTFFFLAPLAAAPTMACFLSSSSFACFFKIA
jgi:hypothetical protein